MTEATQVVTVTDFLLARIDEDEALALRPRGTAFGHWRFVPDPGGRLGGYVAPGGAYASPVTAIANDWSGTQVGAGYVSVAEHIARHDPARVLAECEAKRRIVNYFRVMRENAEQFDTLRLSDADAVLTMLAAVYGNHPDHREEWLP